MSETNINTRISPSALAPAASHAATRSAQNSRIAALANPNAALQDMQEEVAFALGEKMQSKNAEDEKVEERSAALLKEFARRIRKKSNVEDKLQEPLQQKIENNLKSITRREGEGGDSSYSNFAWKNLMALSPDKIAIFAALDALREKSQARGDSQSAHQYETAQARCAREYAPQIRAAINIGEDSQLFAKKHNLPAQQVLDAYQKTVADYSGILNAALTLTEKLGLENSAAGATFIRETVGKEITTVRPSVSPEQLLHILAELKGLQVLGTVKEQVSQHREAMARNEKVAQTNSSSSSSSSAPSTTARGIATLSNENLVTGVFHSAVKPQSFQERLDKPASKAYHDKPSALIMHLQGLHKIFKSLPDYAFADRLGKQRALLPLETRLDGLVALEREAMSS